MKGTTGEGADQKFLLLQSLELSVGMTEPSVRWSHSFDVVSHGARGRNIMRPVDPPAPEMTICCPVMGVMATLVS